VARKGLANVVSTATAERAAVRGEGVM